MALLDTEQHIVEFAQSNLPDREQMLAELLQEISATEVDLKGIATMSQRPSWLINSLVATRVLNKATFVENPDDVPEQIFTGEGSST